MEVALDPSELDLDTATIAARCVVESSRVGEGMWTDPFVCDCVRACM